MALFQEFISNQGLNDFVVPCWTPGPESAPTDERVAIIAGRSLEWKTWEWCRVAQLIRIIYKMALELASCAVPLEHQVPSPSPFCPHTASIPAIL